MNEEPIIEVECQEPKGTFIRRVYPMKLTHDNLTKFWSKSRKYPTLFSQELRDDFDKFIDTFVCRDDDGTLMTRGLLWVVDDFLGVFYITDIRPELDALCHFSFFDGRIKGRDKLAKEMVKYVFKEYKFRRLTAHVPLFLAPCSSGNGKATPAVAAFIKSIGFKPEGRIRKAAIYRNTYFDVIIFGILREEAESDGG